jgi:hypothetical protein
MKQDVILWTEYSAFVDLITNFQVTLHKFLG